MVEQQVGGRHRLREPADTEPATAGATATTTLPATDIDTPGSGDPDPPRTDDDTTAPKRRRRKTRPQPVLTASAVQTVLAALVTVGWVQLDDVTVTTLGTVIAGLLALVTTFSARGKVTPVSAPRGNDGRTLH